MNPQQQPSEPFVEQKKASKRTTKRNSSKTKIKNHANGATTCSFKLEKVESKITKQHKTGSKNKSSRLMFVDESENTTKDNCLPKSPSESSSSSHTTDSENVQPNVTTITTTTTTTTKHTPSTVNKRLCKLRKQLKNCDNFTENYFVIDLNNRNGQTKVPQVVSFKSPTEHFVLHDDDTHSDEMDTHDECQAEAAVDKTTKPSTRRKRATRKIEQKNAKEQPQQSSENSSTDLYHQDANSRQYAEQVLQSQQDSGALVHLLQTLVQQHGSDLLKQLQQQLLSQYQVEIENLLRQANMALPRQPENNTTSDDQLLFDDLPFLNEFEHDTFGLNGDETQRWDPSELAPTSPLTTLYPVAHNDKEILMEEGDCTLDLF